MSRWGREAGERAWKSPPAGGARRGIVLPVSYTAATRGPARSIFTVRTSSGSFSFMPVDLDTGPILAPEYGFFIRALPRKPVETAAVKPAAGAQSALAAAVADALVPDRVARPAWGTITASAAGGIVAVRWAASAVTAQTALGARAAATWRHA